MAALERVTVTLPAETVGDIDEVDENRSRFILEAVRRELRRRRQEALQRSLSEPHPEIGELADAGIEEWGAQLPEEDAASLLDPGGGTAVRWVVGQGWTEVKK